MKANRPHAWRRAGRISSVAEFPGNVFEHERFEGEFGDWKQVADEFHGSLGGMGLTIRIRERDGGAFMYQLSHYVEFEPDGVGNDHSSSLKPYPFSSRESALLSALAELWRAHRREDKVGTWQANPEW